MIHFEEIEAGDVPDLNTRTRHSEYQSLYEKITALPIGKFIRVPAGRATATKIQCNVKQFEFRSRIQERIRTQWHRESEALFIWKEVKTEGSSTSHGTNTAEITGA